MADYQGKRSSRPATSTGGRSTGRPSRTSNASSAKPRTFSRPGSKPASGRPASKRSGNAPKTAAPGPQEFRLQKFLASAGLGSRRQCEELIRTGRVTIDGMPVENPGINVDPLKQVIEYDGERLKPERHKYFVLNKPKGVLCTNHDPNGRTKVIDLFAKERIRLFPVGRLDEESEGLLIVTNDGDLANQLAHPRYRIYRTYRIQVAGAPTNEQLQELRDGMYFREGKFRVIAAHRVGKQGKSSFLEVVLGQGHNREVRRLFARIGHKVLSLERVAFGPLKLQKLKPGQYREMTKHELDQLRDILERNRDTPGEAPQTRAMSASTERAARARPPARTSTARAAAVSQTGSEETQSGTDDGFKKRIRRPAATGIASTARSYKPRSERTSSPRTDRTSRPKTERSSSSRTERSSEQRTERPYKPRTERSFEPRSDRTSRPKTERPSGPRTERSSEQRTERPYKPRTERSSEPRSDRTARPKTDRPSGPRSERSSEQRTERPYKPRTERSFEPRTERTSRPKTERSSGPRTERSSEPRGERSPRPKADWSPQSKNSRPQKPKTEQSADSPARKTPAAGPYGAKKSKSDGPSRKPPQKGGPKTYDFG